MSKLNTTDGLKVGALGSEVQVISASGAGTFTSITASGATVFSNTFTVGVDGTGYDVKLFSATASHYWLWDEDADTNIIIGKFRQGTFSSTAAVTGNALSVASNTAQARFYADDGGVALSSAVSIPDLRGVLGRVLVTADNAANDLRLHGVMGHIKTYDGEWGNEQVGSVHGYLELVRNTGTINFQNYGVSAGVMSTVETSGTMTVDANHTIAGLAAISKMTSGLTQTGKTAGVYVGIYDITNWSDNTARSKWKYGLYIDEDAVDFCPIAVGDFVASAGTGGGFVMTATNSAAVRIYAEDGGVNATSAATLRAILGRSLISGNYTQEAEVFGLAGQVVVKQATVNHNTAGMFGSWEAQTTAATITGTSGDNIHAGSLGRVGVSVTGTTVSATGVLAGVAAMSNITDGYVTITTGGILAGMYVGSWASKQKWQYGLYINEDSVDYCPIAVGKFVSAAASGGGFAVTLTNSSAVRVYAETTADLTSAAMVRATLGRMLVTGNFTQTAECFGSVGQLVVNNTKVQHDGAGVMGSFEVQTTAATISGDIGDHCMAGVLGRVGVSITATTVEADGILAGVGSMSNITDGYVTVTSGGVLAGFYAGKFSSKQDWDYGLYISQSGVVRGISVGKYSSTVDDGLDQSGATWLNGFFADDSGENLTGVRRNLIARTLFTVDQSTASADYSVIRGHLKAASGVDFSGDTSFRNAVHGYVEMAGATICGAGAFFSGVVGELWGDGDITGTGLVGGLMSRIYTSAGSVTGTVAGLVVCKQFASTQTFTHGVYIQDGSVATGMDIRLQGGATISSGSAEPTHSAVQGSIYMRTGQGVNATFYSNTNGSTGWTLWNAVQA